MLLAEINKDISLSLYYIILFQFYCQNAIHNFANIWNFDLTSKSITAAEIWFAFKITFHRIVYKKHFLPLQKMDRAVFSHLTDTNV